ncbi:MAG: hypothetical protein ACFFD4_17855 [Candidatus Odinarchaeota archaeon]
MVKITKSVNYRNKLKRWSPEDLTNFVEIMDIRLPPTIGLKKIPLTEKKPFIVDRSKVVDFLVENHMDIVDKFLTTVDSLDISPNKAKDVLKEYYAVKGEVIENIGYKYQILMILYYIWKNRLSKDDDYSKISTVIDELKFLAGYEKYREKWQIDIETEKELDYERLESIKIPLRDDWNKENPDKKIKITSKVLIDNSALITVYSEIGKRFCNQFKFRADNQVVKSELFDLEALAYYPLAYKHINIRKLDKKWEITVNFDPSTKNNKKILDFILNRYIQQDIGLKGFTSMTERKARKIAPQIERKIGDAKDIKEFIEIIANNRLQAKERLKNLSNELKEKEYEKIQKILETIHWSGIEIVGDTKQGITKFTCMIEPENFFRSIPTAKQFIDDLFQNAKDSRNEERLQFSLSINNKPVKISLKGQPLNAEILDNYEWKALKIFFGGD